jgi:MGT family glycosyltransferase
VGRILFTLWPFAGHVHSNMAIAQALKAFGHRVAVYTGRTAQATFEREGFRCFPFVRVDEEDLLRLLMSDLTTASVVWHPMRRFAVLRAWLADTLPQQVEDQSAVLDAWQPDVVISDVTMWGVPLFLHEMRSIPVVVSLFMPNCMIPGPDAPPWGLGLPRPHNWRTRALARLARAATDLLATGFRRRVSELRQRYGLSALSVDVQTFLGQMELYLVPSTPEFDYQRRDLPPSVHYVGPLVWNKHSGEPSPTWLTELPADRPLVHVTEGTMHAGPPLVLRAAAQGLADLPLQVVMTSGKRRDPASLNLGSIAPNVRVERWVPHSDLLPRTDVMVTTGGGSTVVAGVQAGVPMVVVPTQWDKPENAQRVVEAGVGLRLAPRRCTPKRLRAAVERILSDGSFRENAQRMAATFVRYGGAQQAAELTVRLVASQKGQTAHGN